MQRKFELAVTANFAAAMKVTHYPGVCGQLHGHTYIVTAFLTTATTDQHGMVVDHNIVHTILANILAEIDHKYLNDLPYFKIKQPTSEHIAEFIFNKMFVKTEKIAALTKISIQEKPNVIVSYS